MLIKKRNFVNVTLAILLFLFCLPSGRAYAVAKTAIFVDNVPVLNVAAPYESQGTLLVPLRLVAEELGADVNWDGKQVHIQDSGVDILLTVGEKTAILNGERQTLLAAPQMKQNTVFVPLRFISEALGADVLYRDQKIFMYTPMYDDSRAKSGIFERGDVMYFHQDGKIYRQNIAVENTGNTDKHTGKIYPKTDDPVNAVILIEKPSAYGLAAVSNSGLLFSSPYGGKYYSFKDKTISDYNTGWGDLYFFTPFSKIGKFFYQAPAESIESLDGAVINGVRIPVEQRISYDAIWSQDIDGGNIQEVYVEENQYAIWGLTYYDGWLYYQRMVPVAKEWGYDRYSGSVSRVSVEGGQRQDLTPERVCNWSVQADGLHYELKNQKYILPFADMPNINQANAES